MYSEEEYALLKKAAPQLYQVTLSPGPAVDQTKSFTVTALGAPAAAIDGLTISCTQPDGTTKTFNILAGETPTAVPGAGNLYFTAGCISVKNAGTLDGTIYMRVVDDTGTEKYSRSGSVAVGAHLLNAAFKIDMPTRNYTLTVEVGH
jgi:hypothetical protein